MWINLPALVNAGVLGVPFFANAVNKPNEVCGQIVDNSKSKNLDAFFGAFFDETKRKNQNCITFCAIPVDKLATGL